MKPQEPVGDPTQPHTVSSLNPQSFTEPVAGSGLLEARFNISRTRPLVPWKQREFRGGPDIYVQEPGGRTKLIDQRDFKERSFTASDTGESEQTASVIPVNDLGLEAAASVSRDKFHEFYSCWENDLPIFETEHYMSIDELRRHLGCMDGGQDRIEELIGEEMVRNFERSAGGNEDYLPLDAFEAIFNIETIKSIVKETHPKSAKPMWREMVARIIGTKPNEGYRRILGILVLMDQASCIGEFIREGITDTDLPIPKSHSDDEESETRNRLHTLFKSRHRNFIELFYIYQRRLFVPFFDIQEGKLRSYTFGPETVLPWKDYTKKTDGGIGLVHRIQIHPKHHNFKISNDPQTPLYFALKEISATDRDTYQQELWALQKSTSQIQREKHLIKLLLTYEYGDKCYFLFEWADGNLSEFWDQPNIIPAPSDTWAVQQCLGISSAIKRIHGLATWQKDLRSSLGSGSDDERGWGRHGDIKPNNILWFSTYGGDPNRILHHHLVVSDLGLTRYHSRASRSAVPWLHIEGYTRAYRPPEMDMDHLISQKYDIWSLGCVFLEFCVWYVEGGKAVQTFGLERGDEDKSEIENVEEDKYFNVITDDQGGKKAVLKPIVEKYITKLRDAKECTPFVKQMLDLIQHGMLVVDAKERFKIDQVCTDISEIKRSLKPETELTQTIDVTLRVIPSEGQHSVELDAVQIDTLVHHAEGNSDDVATDSGRRRSLSIRSEKDDSEHLARNMHDSAKASFLADDEPKDERPEDTDSKGMQTTLNIQNNSPFPKPPVAKTGAQTTALRPRPGVSIQGESGKVKAIETQKPRNITLINADLVENSGAGAPLHGQASRTENEQQRQHVKIRVLHQWAVLRNKVERYTRGTLRSLEQTKKRKSRTI
ncbi:hypothetical protein Hte_008753 [Hypoxylon texense]